MVGGAVGVEVGSGGLVADAAGIAVGAVALQCVPGSVAARTVGRAVGVGKGLGDRLGTALSVILPAVGGAANALLPSGRRMLQLVKANVITSRRRGMFGFSFPP